MGEERKLFTGWPWTASPGPAVRRRSNKPCGAEPEPNMDVLRRVSETCPYLLACTDTDRDDQRNGGQPEHFNPGLRAKSVFEQEMGPGRSDGLGTGLLPGGDHHIGNPVALAGQAAFGVGLAVKTRTQVVQGKVDDSRHP